MKKGERCLRLTVLYQRKLRLQNYMNPPPPLGTADKYGKMCSGCEFQFKASEYRKQNDMVFWYMMHCKHPDGKGKQITNPFRSPAYFHAHDLGCLCQLTELKKIEKADLYMTNETRCVLTQDHINMLKKRGLWDDIIRTREQLIQNTF